ncbi:MAG: hypothetical protein Fur0037_24460 [Planctomycetota bacterium]
MRSTHRLSFALALVLSLLAEAAAGQGAPSLRRQPGTPGWQDQVNEVFGDLLSWFSYLPFYDIAGALGLDTAPHRVLGPGGEPAADSLVLRVDPAGVEFAAFSPSGRRVLAADSSHAIRVFSLFRARWKSESEKPEEVPDPLLAVLRGHEGRITALASFPDDPPLTDVFYRTGEILSASEDGTARLWRMATDQETADGAPAPSAPVARGAFLVLRHGAPVTAACYSATGLWVATGGSDGSAAVWDAAGKKLWSSPATGKPVAKLSFGGDERLMVSDGSSAPAWFDARTGTASSAPEGPGDEAPDPWLGEALEIRGDGVALSVGDGSAILLAGHEAPVRGAALAADSTRALSWSGDGSVRVWNWLVRGPTGDVAAVSVPFVVLWLVVAAVLFTLFFKFVNFRMFRHAIQCVRGVYSDPNDAGEVSHFQALSAALSATVGLGNIAGVAIAVMIGGPGATFWMIVAGLLGMTLKFTECTLGQKFRKIDEHGIVSGGPMHYLKDGIARRWPALAPVGGVLAVIFSLFCMGGSVAGGNAFQVNQSLGVLRGQIPFFDQYPWVYGLGMAFFVGIVIIGGIKSIARVADKIVPLMCGVYVLSALLLILMHLPQVPQAFGRIVSSALSGDAVYGGAVGALIMGFRRAAFSNEAGVGSASIAHSAARTPFPVREGIVALLEPFIDTVVVCTMTALVIGITGVYNAPEHAEIIAAQNGAGLTAEAFKSVAAFRSWFPWLLMIAVALFAYSTMISWSYYGERCATKLFGPRASLPFKLLFLVFTVLGSIVTATNVLEFGDLMILLMAFPNIIGLYLLGGIVKGELRDYEQRLALGEIRAFK